MAEGKKGFILYTDLIHTVKKLPIEKRGELFTVILEYVNDEDPEVTDLLIDLVWEPVKRQLKRDLEHWESIKLKRSEAGKLGGRPIKQTEAKKANALFDKQKKQSKAKKAVIVNDIVKVNVNDTGIVTDTVNEKVKEKEIKIPAVKNGPYQIFVEMWFLFYENRTGLKPKMNAVAGTKIKSIITYLETLSKDKNFTAAELFQQVLFKWNKMDDWLQKNCLDLGILDQKLPLIINQLKTKSDVNNELYSEMEQKYGAGNPQR